MYSLWKIENNIYSFLSLSVIPMIPDTPGCSYTYQHTLVKNVV